MEDVRQPADPERSATGGDARYVGGEDDLWTCGSELDRAHAVRAVLDLAEHVLSARRRSGDRAIR